MNLARVGILVVAILLGASSVRAQSPPAFRVELDREAVPRGPAVAGYVYNDHLDRVGNVRLRVEILDAAGARLTEAYGWVYGSIPAGGRAYFVVRLTAKGAEYRVSVVSFDWLSRGGP